MAGGDRLTRVRAHLPQLSPVPSDLPLQPGGKHQRAWLSCSQIVQFWGRAQGGGTGRGPEEGSPRTQRGSVRTQPGPGISEGTDYGQCEGRG